MVDELAVQLTERAELAGHPRVVALVPAHNEEAAIGLALDSLAAQTRRPDLVIVIPDNCTDGTVAVVHSSFRVVTTPTRRRGR
jgi:glycosyltransferase involved in cell wall biosynthesis